MHACEGSLIASNTIRVRQSCGYLAGESGGSGVGVKAGREGAIEPFAAWFLGGLLCWAQQHAGPRRLHAKIC